MQTRKLSIKQLVGKGYSRGWYTIFKGRYRAYKGARNTKKSYVMIGLEVLMKIMQCPLRNILILRETYISNQFSTFSTLKYLITLLGLERYFTIKENPFTIIYKPTGQLILFGGMKDCEKITSMRMPKGFLTDVYVEEAFEITDYESWRKVDGTIRGVLPEGYFFQITFCFNAWNKDHWLYEKLFKGRLEDDYQFLETHDYQDYRNDKEIIEGGYGKGIYLHISTYKINEFRNVEEYDEVMQRMKELAFELYKVEGLGMWGNASESTYPEFKPELIVPIQEVMNQKFSVHAIGIDTGLSDGTGHVKKVNGIERLRSATTMQLVGITSDYSKIYGIDEFYHSNENALIKKTEPQLQEDIIKILKEWQEKYKVLLRLYEKTTVVYVDSADKGFRQGLELEARRQGLVGFVFMASSKNVRIVDRVMFIRRIMAYGDYKVCSQCKNLIREIKNSRKGDNKIREDIDDHAINSQEYAWIPIIGSLKSWKEFKPQG